MRSNSVIGSGLCPRLKIRWVLSTVNSLIRRSAAIRLIVALNVWESGAPSAPQNTYGGLGQRPEATRRRKSKKGGLMRRLTRDGLLGQSARVGVRHEWHLDIVQIIAPK